MKTNGYDMVLGIEQVGSVKPIAYSVECQLQSNLQIKEVAGAAQAKAQEFLPGIYGWTISTSGLYASGGSMVDLMQLLKEGTKVYVQFNTTGGGNIDIYSGSAYITSIAYAGSVRNKATYQVQLTGTGELATQKHILSTDGVSVRFIMSGKNITGVTNGVTITRSDFETIADIFDGKQSNVYPPTGIYLDGELVSATIIGVQLECNGIIYNWSWYTNRYISSKQWRMTPGVKEAKMRILFRYMHSTVKLEWMIKTTMSPDSIIQGGGNSDGEESQAPPIG